jgi:uncharacterized protein with GYD domain
MYFVTLVRFRRKPTKEDFKVFDETEKEFEKRGLRILYDFYTLGRFDNVLVIEAPDEKVLVEFLERFFDLVATETLVAIPRAEGRKLFL